MSSTGWIGVDLDGTLATYDTWHGIDHIGDPIAPMVDRVKQWLDEGKEVRIMTARVSRHGFERTMATHIIEHWCREHIGRVLPVTHEKDFGMEVLYDDRCVQVEKNTGELTTYDSPPCPLCGEGAIANRTDTRCGAKALCCFACGAEFEHRAAAV